MKLPRNETIFSKSYKMLTTPLLFSNKSFTAIVDGFQDIGLQSVIKKGFWDQKRNEFQKIIIQYDK